MYSKRRVVDLIRQHGRKTTLVTDREQQYYIYEYNCWWTRIIGMHSEKGNNNNNFTNNRFVHVVDFVDQSGAAAAAAVERHSIRRRF